MKEEIRHIHVPLEPKVDVKKKSVAIHYSGDSSIDWTIVFPGKPRKSGMTSLSLVQELRGIMDGQTRRGEAGARAAVQAHGVIAEAKAGAVSEHEKTRELVTEKIESLHSKIDELEASLGEKMAELAQSRELQAHAERLTDEIRLEGERTRADLEAQINDLRAFLGKFSPEKRFFKTTFAFFCLFCISELIYAFSSVEILSPFWGVIGLLVTLSMLVVIYFGKRDSDVPDNQSRTK